MDTSETNPSEKEPTGHPTQDTNGSPRTPAEDYATGSHDLPVSPALTEFMTQSWLPGPPPDEDSLPVADRTPARRARLAARFPGQWIVVPAGQLKIRSYDMHYRFRPHSAYTYLTGDQTPDGVLVIDPDGAATLYPRPRSPRDTRESYRDHVCGEFWTGGGVPSPRHNSFRASRSRISTNCPTCGAARGAPACCAASTRWWTDCCRARPTRS